MVPPKTLLRHIDGNVWLYGGHNFEGKFEHRGSTNDFDENNCGQQWDTIWGEMLKYYAE